MLILSLLNEGGEEYVEFPSGDLYKKVEEGPFRVVAKNVDEITNEIKIVWWDNQAYEKKDTARKRMAVVRKEIYTKPKKELHMKLMHTAEHNNKVCYVVYKGGLYWLISRMKESGEHPVKGLKLAIQLAELTVKGRSC